MGSVYLSFAQTFGPLIQLIYFLFILLLAAVCIGGAAFWCECKLVQTRKRILWMFPFPVLALGLLYGCLRFSGQLLYFSDGWDQGGCWNYTNQNAGAYMLFVCGCLAIGVVLAARKKSSK